MATRKQLIDEAGWQIAHAIEFDESPGAAAATIEMLEIRVASEPGGLTNDNAVRDLYPLTDEERAEIIAHAEKRAYAK